MQEHAHTSVTCLEDSQEPGIRAGLLEHMEKVAGFALDDIENTTARPCAIGGIIVHYQEATDLFNLLEANPHAWNRRLRATLAGWILHLIKQGKLDGHFEVVDERAPNTSPGR